MIWKLGGRNSIFYRSFGPLKYTAQKVITYLLLN
nr:MAG TPA: hypothetical protein [Caudoviricetes sp.]